MELQNRRTGIFLLFIGAFSIVWCIYRDLQLRKQHPGDLRNRIVGSRLQQDGISPYFYHWTRGDSLRYYDWNNGTTNLKVSNVTASPFFHWLLTPISGFSQYTISIIWLAWNYTIILAMVFIALWLATDRYQKLAVVVTGLIFLHTYAWTNLIVTGQMYLTFTFLCMLFYLFITRKPSLINAFLAGIIAISIVLIRSTAILYLVPFCLLANRFSLRYKVVFVLSALTLFFISFNNQNPGSYWKDYQVAVREHVKVHQRLAAATQQRVVVPDLPKLEGWDTLKIKEAVKFPFYKDNSMNGNVFVFINKTFNVRTPVAALAAMCLAVIAIIAFLFYSGHRSAASVDLFSIALLGFIAYMTTDFFSPIHRFHYNASQWAFPLLLAASRWSPHGSRLFTMAVLIGLVLNSLPFSMFRMQQSIGEYFVYFAMISLVIQHKTESPK